jgi:hypothetical protein
VSLLTAMVIFIRVHASEGEMLFFASSSHIDTVKVENAGVFFHKKKYLKKGGPDAVFSFLLINKIHP